ncbi:MULTISPECIES: arabinosylfuranosidase ArfA [Micromonospora]|uniref:non-reducing end alpha-L-arabinofuranosidase n=1 Tax=Micromonospora yangpuensis TaxID=683228 RepID=A0A1C6VBV8_9ACTN|nr:alpha-N-arabinofuranosidase [Micromonospora yangpuensis]GGM12674.1 alpha-N-arabinofuranosidase [Micromonospora yangpuensis]SCL63832.1 alpha-N-arabinofuranosidase [Micromonospora yangpuensis]
MRNAQLTIDPAFAVGPADRRLFGSFVEHLGRCVYGGIHEPGHPRADARGLRGDVLELTRELGVSVVRYPGGNFVSGYRWEDGVGPVADRPRRLDLAWKTVETNAFGLDEFMSWAATAEVEPMMAVNLGTRGVQEACDLLEYANHPGGTELSDRRRRHGAEQPYGIRLWCLGNELDGPWQVGHKTADEYGRLAAETARAMKLIDPSISLVACGSSGRGMPTFAAWEATVLEHTYEHVDYISAHTYYDPSDGDRASLLASAVDMDAFITEVVATADHVAARQRQTRKLKISFDEWNVWYQSRVQADLDRRGWVEAPALIEDDYTAVDAVVVGDLLITLLRHADRVGVACQAQLANVIAPIRTRTGGPAWRQSIFHPFALTARYARGTVLRTEPVGPTYATKRYGDVPVLDTVAVRHDETGELAVFAVNRDETDLRLDVDLRGLPALAGTAHTAMTARDDPAAVNTEAEPDRVVPRDLPVPKADGGRCTVRLPALSWNLLRFTPPEG